METLVTKTLRRISAVNDDFFETELVVDALNKSQQKIISYAVQKERETPKRSLRALDLVRRNSEITGSTYTNEGRYYSFSEPFPGISLNQFLYLNYKANGTTYHTPLRELTSNRLHVLENGNIVPSRYEGYFNVDREFTAPATASRYFDFDATVGETSGNDPYILRFELTVTIDSVPRTFSYTSGSNAGTTISAGVLSAFAQSVVTAMNEDAMFYYTAALASDYNASTNIRFVLTAKSPGAKFQTALNSAVTAAFFFKGATGTTTINSLTSDVITTGTDAVTTPVFNVFVHSNDTDNILKVYYVDNPTDIAAYDTAFADLPEQLENAAIYGACMMLLMTEKPSPEGGPSGSVQIFAELYKQELELSSY